MAEEAAEKTPVVVLGSTRLGLRVADQTSPALAAAPPSPA